MCLLRTDLPLLKNQVFSGLWLFDCHFITRYVSTKTIGVCYDGVVQKKVPKNTLYSNRHNDSQTLLSEYILLHAYLLPDS